ncbi:putative protein YxaL [Planctomycetaceae bacterium]|nr:putative protein YxaL [Planctomycetaceae bacterium]
MRLLATNRRKLMFIFFVAILLPLPVVAQTRPLLEHLSNDRLPSSDDTILADTAWPTYQHDFRRTGRSPYQGITKGVGIKWKYEVNSNQVIAVAGMSVGLSGTLYVKNSLDTAVINTAGQQIQALPLGGTCGSVPTLSRNNTIYYEGAAISNTGEILWQVPAANYCSHSTPAFETGGTVYFGVNYSLIAVDTINMTIKWSHYLGEYSGGGTPALGEDGTIYVSSSQSWETGFYAFNPNGSIKWSSTSLGYISNPAIGDDGTIYSAKNKVLTAFNPDGTVKWNFDFDEDMCTLVTPAIASDNTVYFGTVRNTSDYTQTNFYAVNPNGTLKWYYTLYKNGWPRICSSPIVDKDDNVFFCADDGRCYGFDKNGNKLWDLALDEGSWLRTSPVIADDKVMYVTGGKKVYALVEVMPRAYLPLVAR